METKKLTKAAIISALLIIFSIIFCGIGIGSSFYLEFIVPIVITIVYLTCGFKWTLLVGINTILIIGLGLGQVTTSIWLVQSVLIGMIVGGLLLRTGHVMDDLLIGALLGCPVMLLIDYFISILTGVSILESLGFEELITNQALAEGLYYFGIACVPIGTIVLIYVCVLILARRLNILNKQTKVKYKVIRNFLKYKPYLYCSKSLIIGGMLYIIVSTVLPMSHFVYVKALGMSIKCILIYFILMDATAIISLGVYRKTASLLLSNGVGIIVIVLLVGWFEWSLYGIMLLSLSIDFKMHIRERQTHILKCLVQY